jgi:hypothetical protein
MSQELLNWLIFCTLLSVIIYVGDYLLSPALCFLSSVGTNNTPHHMVLLNRINVKTAAIPNFGTYIRDPSTSRYFFFP